MKVSLTAASAILAAGIFLSPAARPADLVNHEDEFCDGAAVLVCAVLVVPLVLEVLGEVYTVLCEREGGVFLPPEAWSAPDGRQWLCAPEGYAPILGVADVGCRTQESPSAPYFADCGGEGRSRTSGLSAAPAAPVEAPAARAAPDPDPPAPNPEPEPDDPPGQGEPGWTPPR